MKIVLKIKNDMRKIFLVLALLMTAFTAISQKFSAVCESGQTLYYNIIDEENHYVELRREGYQLFSGDIIIPGEVTYNGTVYTVKGIGSMAYYDCEGLTSVVIPNTITYIGESAFNCCSNLTSVNIPESVENIGPLAFSSTKINEIYIPRSVKNIGYSIGQFDKITVSPDNPFYDSRNDCNAIIDSRGDTLVLATPNTVVPNDIKAIGMCAFRFIKSLTSFNIPSSVTYIGVLAFSESGLKSIVIPKTVECVAGGAFWYCNSLTSVTIESPTTKMYGDGGSFMLGAIAYCPLVTLSLSTTPVKLEKGTFEIVTKVWGYPYEDEEGDYVPTYYIWVPSGMAKVYNETDWAKVFIIKDE